MDPTRFATTRPDFARPRRVVTEPLARQPQRSNSTPPPSSRSEDLVETLYSHPSVRIISFTSSQRSPLNSIPTSLADNDVQPGTCSASSRLERTIAVGAFRIYRAPGSVAFLSCGTALQPILPRSQCWCIDEGNSRFVLQIRRPQYWRIEVPVEDSARASLLKEVFDKILLFEKTVCPFQRSFTVPLPERPQTPIKKKAWTPVGKNLIPSAFQAELSPPAQLPRPISKERRPISRSIETSATKPDAAEDHRKSFPQTSTEALCEEKPTGPVPGEPEQREDVTQTWHDMAESAREKTIQVECGREKPLTVDDVQAGKSKEITMKRAIRLPEREDSSVSTVVPEKCDHLTLSAQQTPPPIRSPGYPETKVITNIREPAIHEPAIHEPVKPAQCASISGPEATKTEVTLNDGNHCATPPLEDIRLDLGARDTCLSDTTTNRPEETKSSLVLSERGFAEETADASEQGASKGAIVEDDSQGPSSFEGSGRVVPVNLAKKRVTRMLASRSFTAPQLTVDTSPSKPKSQQPSVAQPSTLDHGSPSGSVDSFHSLQSWHSPITPAPPSPSPSHTASPTRAKFPYPHEDIVIPQLHPGAYDSDNAVTPNTDITLQPASAKATNSSERIAPTELLPPTDITSDKMKTDRTPVRSSPTEDSAQLRQRQRPSNLSISRRALSPLPPAANLFSSGHRQTPESRLAVVRRLPSAIVHKTVEILLSPPSHLVNLMLKVAAKIAAGEWRGLVFGLGEGGESIPVQWDYFSDGDISSLEDEDEYMTKGFGQRTTDGNLQTHDLSEGLSPTEENSRSWEVD
ncbi:inheritance of peroxisomes protein 1-domain-containing protein [Xylariaceae sp. FL0016]|nr:inheritance of peroxisomes protein 1-domain-containing protein [Xylariaceae sp. FL0016]